MSSVVFLAVASVGQIFDCPPPPICTPIYSVPDDRVYIYLGTMYERYRTYEYVDYGGEWRKVPVINGYVPDVYRKRRSDGAFDIHYDYTSRTLLKDCYVYGVQKERPSRRAEPPKRTRVEQEPVQRTPAPRVEQEPVQRTPAPEPYRRLPEKTNAPEYEPEYEPEMITPKSSGLKRPSEIQDTEGPAKFPNYKRSNG